MKWHIAMKALVQGEHAEEMGGRLGCSGRAFAGPKEGCEVVGFAAKSTFAKVKTLRSHFMVQDTARQF